jgi:hypothetical protein
MEKPVLQIQVFNSPLGLNDHLKRNPDWWFVQAIVAGPAIHYIAGTDVPVE